MKGDIYTVDNQLSPLQTWKYLLLTAKVKIY